MNHIPRIGIGGPVGSGKSMLIERLVPMLAKIGYSISIISNDVISKEDADRMRTNLATKRGLLPENMVIGLATGGCPHTAVREDPSMNLSFRTSPFLAFPIFKINELFLFAWQNRIFIFFDKHEGLSEAW